MFLFVDLCPQLYTSKVHYCNTNQYEKDLFFTVFTDRSVKNPEQLRDNLVPYFFLEWYGRVTVYSSYRPVLYQISGEDK